MKRRTRGAKVQFASLMDICYLKNDELEANHQKYKGRVVLRGENVKDDSGSYAVFTEQGSSASQMTASKVMDIKSRLPGCARQAADAVSAYTQVPLEDAHKILEKSQIGKSRHLDPPTTTQKAKIIIQYGRPSRSSWAKSVRSSFARIVVGKDIWENPFEVRLGEGFQLGMSLCTLWKRIILICVCGWHKIGWKETKHWSDVESTQKKSRLGRTNIFLDHVYLWCIERQCEISKDIVDKYRTMFESRIAAGATEKLPCSENLRISSWSYDMEGHAKKCVERYCELAHKTTQQLFKVSTPCSDDHHFKEKELKSVRELSKICCQTVLKCLYLARIGYSMVSEQTCTIDNKMDQSMWQTPESPDILYSSHMWIQTVLSCG